MAVELSRGVVVAVGVVVLVVFDLIAVVIRLLRVAVVRLGVCHNRLLGKLLLTNSMVGVSWFRFIYLFWFVEARVSIYYVLFYSE